jgi:hypothetical protein
MNAAKGRAESKTAEQVPLRIDGTIIDGEVSANLEGGVQAEVTLQGNVGSGGDSKISPTVEPRLNACGPGEHGDLRAGGGSWQRLGPESRCRRRNDKRDQSK